MGATTVETSQSEVKSPKQKTKPSHDTSDNQSRTDSSKIETTTNGEPAKPLAPPPRPGQQNGNTPDYFTAQHGGSLSLEPNPFEQSFGAPPETPGGTKLPSVAALTSPSSLLPGSGTTPFNWGGGSLRTGPLSPAMLSGPANDYFGDTHLRGGFPTPNESSLRTGLTPGGSGSMFPAPSPNSQALFAQMQNSGATPSTIDFHRTAMTAAAAKREQQSHQPGNQQHHSGPTSMPPTSAPSQSQEMPSVTSAPTLKAEQKAHTGPVDPHDSDAANGLYLLAQGRSGAPSQPQFAAPPPPQQVQATPVPIPIPGQASQPVPAQVPASSVRGVSTAVGYSNGTSNSTASLNGFSVNGAGGSGRGTSEARSAASEDSEVSRPSPRGKGKRNSDAAATNGRRKAQEPASKTGPATKKAKTSSTISMPELDEDDSGSDDDDSKLTKDGHPKQKMTEEEKRKNFLERNRVAALKCRQRKKQWLQNLQTKVELYSSENETLTAQITQLREEVVNLKTLLLAHKDCPVTQQQGLNGSSGGAYMQQPMEQYSNAQINPYGMAAPMHNQQVIAGQVGQRRFS